jgi:hypothetical protein
MAQAGIGGLGVLRSAVGAKKLCFHRPTLGGQSANWMAVWSGRDIVFGDPFRVRRGRQEWGERLADQGGAAESRTFRANGGRTGNRPASIQWSVVGYRPQPK